MRVLSEELSKAQKAIERQESLDKIKSELKILDEQKEEILVEEVVSQEATSVVSRRQVNKVPNLPRFHMFKGGKR